MLTQIAAFGITLAVEVPLVTAAALLWQVSYSRGIAAGLLASSLTHPLAWWVSRQLGPQDYLAWIFALEGVVCLFEAVVLKFLLVIGWRRAIALAVMANAASVLVGILLWN